MAKKTTPPGPTDESIAMASLLVPQISASSSSAASTNRLLRVFHRYEYTSPLSLEPLYRLYVYPAEYDSLHRLLVLFIALTVSLAIVDFVLVASFTVENVSCVLLCVIAVALLIFVHTRQMSPRQLPRVYLQIKLPNIVVVLR